MAMESDKAAAQAGEVPEILNTFMTSYKSFNGGLYLGNKDIDVKCTLHTDPTTNGKIRLFTDHTWGKVVSVAEIRKHKQTQSI